MRLNDHYQKKHSNGEQYPQWHEHRVVVWEPVVHVGGISGQVPKLSRLAFVDQQQIRHVTPCKISGQDRKEVNEGDKAEAPEFLTLGNQQDHECREEENRLELDGERCPDAQHG